MISEALDTYRNGRTNCGPSWTPRNANGCYLWSHSYNARYISNLDNGRGWNETITWKEARNNTHGVDSGAVNDAFNCDGKESTTNLCGTADDENWSRMVIQSRSAVSNGVTSTWSYKYYLRTSLPAPPCSNCNQGYTWGNQNDADYADYYNGQFMSFYQVQVTQPDNSYQVHTYGATDGWGLANSSITCYETVPCHPAPYWGAGTLLAGKDQEEDDYDSQNHLLTVHKWSYTTNCPPPGVAGSLNAAGGSSDPGSSELFSQLDVNNPVVVCDPRVSQQDSYQVDGVTGISSYSTDARVPHKQVNESYDTDNQGPNQVAGYDYGNLSNVDTTANDVGGWHFVTHTTYYPNDSLGSSIFLTNLVAQTQIQDASKNDYVCTQTYYGGNASASTPPTLPDVTQDQTFPAATNCSGSSILVKHGYDASGNPITGIDGDTHLGCTSNSNSFTDCATYNSLDVHAVSITNARGQTSTASYDPTAAGGFGEWLTSTTDLNGQTTSFQYDVLGRLVGVIHPGDSATYPTVTYTYINSCTQGMTSPCLELDTATRYTMGGPTSTTKQYYDGWGHLVETRAPGPNGANDILTYIIYDNMGRATTKSLPYAYSSGGGYVNPDTTQARTVTSYDALGRSLGAVTYSDATTIVLSSTINYTVAQGIPSFNVDTTTAFERTTTLDAYNHESIGFSDALGRHRYDELYSGTSSPYTLIRIMQYNRDYVGNMTSVYTYDGGTLAVLGRMTATYDSMQRQTGMNDTDLGDCSWTTMPTSCSSSSDTAWKYTYDSDSNLLSQTDPRNSTTYTSYDNLDRPLCRGTSSASVNPCQNSTYAIYFYDSYDNSSNSSVTFPNGCVAPSGSYASDPVGHVTAEVFSSSVGSGWRCAGFDQRGELNQSTLSITADSQTTTQTVNLTYNDGGELTALVYPDGETLTSQYDLNGRFQSAYFGSSSTPDPVNFLVGQTSYTTVGQLSGYAFGGSAPKAGTPTPVFTTSYGYDGIQRALSSSATVGSSTIWSQTRTYDNVGNILQLTTTVPTTSGGTLTENQSFCYDALSRLVWAGNTGTATGGDHCGANPTGATLPTYQQSFSYDNRDRIISGPAGNYSYDSNHAHAVISLSSIPNQYAAYDAMGNMTCRNVDTTTGHTCAGTPTGALMTYDNEGRLVGWTAPSGSTSTDGFLYDNEGNRVFQRTSVSGVVSDTITFDGYTETVISGGITNTTKYYLANGQRLAMRTSNTLYYLLSDGLGSSNVALNSDGSTKAVQLFAPYGTTRYSQGTMPTTYNFTGQRLDSLTGLLYYNFRYYDSFSGRFVRADTKENSAIGMDAYAYVADNPESKRDPSGHYDDPIATKAVEEWYVAIEAAAGNPVQIDQPQSLITNKSTYQDKHNPFTAIQNASVPTWLRNNKIGIGEYLQSMADQSNNGAQRNEGYADIMNLALHLIYEVKGPLNGTDNVPSADTLRIGYATARWYAHFANAEGSYGATDWRPGTTQEDPALSAALGGGNNAIIPYPGDPSRMIMVFYLGPGLLTYTVFPVPGAARPINAPAGSWYWQIIQTILLAALAALAGAASNGGSNPGGYTGGYAGNYGTGGSAGYGRSGGEMSNAGGGCSFTFDTLVWTINGERAIGQLIVGDQVFAYNPTSHQIEVQPIMHVWVHSDNDLIDLTLTPHLSSHEMNAQGKTDELIHTTSEHPFFTQEEGFVSAGQLKAGMHVIRANGEVGVIVKISVIKGAMVMYNLEVAHDHTFMVGNDQWIVHNWCD